MLTKVSIHALRGAGRSIGVDSGRPSTRGRASPAMTMWAASAYVADANNQPHKSLFFRAGRHTRTQTPFSHGASGRVDRMQNIASRHPTGRPDILIKDCVLESKAAVLGKWQRTLFLQDQKDVGAKGWLLSIIRCIEKIGKHTFTINELYSFEAEFRAIYPSNHHIKEKMRQKLQILRDKGFLEFLGGGTYRLTSAD